MFIQTETTPNPNTLKFLPGQDVLGVGAVEFTDAAKAGNSPLATALFAIDGVAGVFLGGDFVTISKADGGDWSTVKTQVLAAIMDHYASGKPVLLQ